MEFFCGLNDLHKAIPARCIPNQRTFIAINKVGDTFNTMVVIPEQQVNDQQEHQIQSVNHFSLSQIDDFFCHTVNV